MSQRVVTAHAGLFHAGEGDPKKKRTMLVAGAAVALLVFLYIRHKNAAAAAATTTAAPTAAPAASTVTPSTFADNGAQAGALGDSVTNGLSGVQTALDSQTSAFQAFIDQQSANAAAATPAATAGVGQPAATTSPAATSAPAPYVWDPAAAQKWVNDNPASWSQALAAQAAAAQPRAAMSAGGPGVKVNRQVGNPRAGQSYTTKVLPGGNTEHIYASGKTVVVKKH